MNAFLYGLVVALHVAICLILVVVVLLQQGKGDGGLGGAFGGGGSSTVFGSRGPTTFFHYLTMGSAAVFIFTALFLSCTPSPSSKSSGSVIDDTPTPGATAEGMVGTSSGAAVPMMSIAPAAPAQSAAPAATASPK